MTKAFLYDSLCGIVYRCMFAGLDAEGHAQWVVITPGEEPRTVKDFIEAEDFDNWHFCLLTMEGEQARSKVVAQMLGKALECPVTAPKDELGFIIRQLKQAGVTWDCHPLTLEINVFRNGDNSRRQGKYSFWVEDDNPYCSILADIDGFDDLEDLLETVHTYFEALDEAGIPVLDKTLRIDENLLEKTDAKDLKGFDRIEKNH